MGAFIVIIHTGGGENAPLNALTGQLSDKSDHP